MTDKITKTKTHLVIKIPLFKKRYNPYMEQVGKNPYIGTMNAITGLILYHKKDGNDYEECGFATLIDRSYKGKDDDVGDFIYKYHGDEEDFEKLCIELKIGLVKMWI